MKILSFILPILIFFPVALLQFIFVPMIAIDAIAPDIIMILLVYYALKYGQLYGTFLGSIFGLLFDIISGGILGSAMFAKTISGFIAGYFYNENKIETNISTMFLCLLFL
ncbi:MAG: rod shape-determining protein MreD [Ignavibacteriales bacterium]|nr:rod shape-determining protein MreD [Ignavibacteriales bacterium]